MQPKCVTLQMIRYHASDILAYGRHQWRHTATDSYDGGWSTRI